MIILHENRNAPTVKSENIVQRVKRMLHHKHHIPVANETNAGNTPFTPLINHNTQISTPRQEE